MVERLSHHRLCITFTTIAFSKVITVIEFVIVTIIKMLFLSFKIFFGLSLVYCCLTRLNYPNFINSSLLCSIVGQSFKCYFTLYYFEICFQLLDFMLLFLGFVIIVMLILINFKQLANIYRHQQVFHCHRK